MGALMLKPERVSIQGKRPGRRPSRSELLSRLVASGAEWFHAEMGLIRIDAGTLVRRIITGLALATVAFSLLTTSLVVLSEALIDALVPYLDGRLPAALIVAAAFLSCAVVIVLTSLSFLTSRWPAVSLAFRAMLDRASERGGTDG
jgi:hypothetical protein